MDTVWVVFKEGMWWRVFRDEQLARNYADGRFQYEVKQCKFTPI